MEKLSLFEEYRLIERSELEINGAWKGAHLLLFFMAFVFGSFCTFCFHMLMYLFDEKCVLFPKLLSLTSMRHNVIYEFIPVDKESADMLPVDFVGTQWVEKSACYLPTYVPLVSGIFGLVWTTMFLMCSTGSRTQTGLQRPWRVLPPVFVFSVAMGGLCLYSSIVTQNGLDELCIKLGGITGSTSCTYTVNVATLAYERRIRGVYQAIRLTTLSAWLHTSCWLLSAVLTVVRVALAVDFQLVRIKVDLIGNMEKILEHHEKQIRTVSPDVWINNESNSEASLPISISKKGKYKHKKFTSSQTEPNREDEEVEVIFKGDFLYVSKFSQDTSAHALLLEESLKLARLAAYEKVPKDQHFIVKIVYDLVQSLSLADTATSSSLATTDSEKELLEAESEKLIVRQLGQEKIRTIAKPRLVTPEETKRVGKEIRRMLQKKLNEKLDNLHSRQSASVQTSFSPEKSPSTTTVHSYESESNITEEMKNIIEANASKNKEYRDSSDTEGPSKVDSNSKAAKKSNLKYASVQTDSKSKRKAAAASPRVQIAEPTDVDQSTETVQDAEKETQTFAKKEKQD